MDESPKEINILICEGSLLLFWAALVFLIYFFMATTLSIPPLKNEQHGYNVLPFILFIICNGSPIRDKVEKSSNVYRMYTWLIRTCFFRE